ncbi:PREDICTED: probable E3 ubiquitin-protein ligase ATL44 [Tarenaya hassleriana]|uniref:probable E3 ubiquitin-protein ligase ATL44 n=1 Tax=Tarenaya hassleriana TaxID=28532 RepID=UPI00053C3E0B|nr:PREDICTED: probable E3 ubiquitin-protein ligase ATL44 [Tarenaya hassleriana]
MTRPLAAGLPPSSAAAVTTVAPIPPAPPAVEIPLEARLMVWLFIIILALCLYCRFAVKGALDNSVSAHSTALPPTIPSPRTGLSSLSETLSSYECVICLEDLADRDEVFKITVLGCGHGFHAVCLDKWFRSKLSCPSCRRVPLSDKSEESGGEKACRYNSGAGD